MRIGIVHPEILHRGGAENLTLWLAAGLRDRGHDLTIFSAGIDLDQWPEIDVSGIRFVDLPDRRIGFWQQPGRSRRHGRIIAAEAPPLDLFIAGNYPSYLWLADAIPRMNQRPVTLMFCQEPFRKHYFVHTDWPTIEYFRSGRRTLPFHDVLEKGARYRERAFTFSKIPLARWYDRLKLKRIDSIWANSEFSSRNATKAFGRPVEPCLLGAPDPYAGDSPPPMEGRSGVVALTGWHRAKNPEAVMGTLAHLANRLGRRDIPVTITGRGVLPEHESYMRREGIYDLFDIRGFVTEEDKHRLLASARLCLFVPWAEPFGLVPVEAMFHGTPVVATDIGGPSEVVVDGETGALVDGSDPEAIATAIARLYDDVPRLEAMGRAGRLRAERHFSLKGFIDRFEAKALELVERTRTRSG